MIEGAATVGAAIALVALTILLMKDELERMGRKMNVVHPDVVDRDRPYAALNPRSAADWPTNDREWARNHIGCNVSTCPNGKCQSTGECVDSVRNHVTAAEREAAAGPRWVNDAPPLVPARSDPYLPSAHAALDALNAPPRSNTGHGHVRSRPDGMKARCGGPGMCSVCSREAAALAPAVESPPLAPAILESQEQYNAPRTIIAFTGLAGSGKSTAAAHLVKHHGFQRVRFAGPLKSMMAALGLTPAEIDGDRKEQPCALLGGKTPRHAMQTLGTEWGRDLIAPDLWIRAFNAALAKVPAGVPVVVDDCRFPNEADAVRAAGGVLVAIERPGAGAGAAGHKSEGNALRVDRTLYNLGTEAELLRLAAEVVADLSWRDCNTAA